MVSSFINLSGACISEVWKSSKLYRLRCFRSPQTMSTWADKPAQTTQQAYGSLRWPWSCEFPDTLHSKDANHRKMKVVFWRGRTFDGTARICHLYMDLGSGAKHQGSEIQAVFLLLCLGSPLSVQQTDAVHTSASCLWPAAVSTLPWGSAANPFLESHQAHNTGFVCVQVLPYLMWPHDDEELHWEFLCAARIRVVFAFHGGGRRPAEEFVRQ